MEAKCYHAPPFTSSAFFSRSPRKFPLDIHIQPGQVSQLPPLDEEKNSRANPETRGDFPKATLSRPLSPMIAYPEKWKRKFKNTLDADPLP